MPEVHSASYFQVFKTNDSFCANHKIRAARISYCGALLKATAETVVSAIVWPFALIVRQHNKLNGRIRFSAKAVGVALSGILDPNRAHNKLNILYMDRQFPARTRKQLETTRNTYISNTQGFDESYRSFAKRFTRDKFFERKNLKELRDNKAAGRRLISNIEAIRPPPFLEADEELDRLRPNYKIFAPQFPTALSKLFVELGKKNPEIEEDFSVEGWEKFSSAEKWAKIEELVNLTLKYMDQAEKKVDAKKKAEDEKKTEDERKLEEFSRKRDAFKAKILPATFIALSDHFKLVDEEVDPDTLSTRLQDAIEAFRARELSVSILKGKLEPIIKDRKTRIFLRVFGKGHSEEATDLFEKLIKPELDAFKNMATSQKLWNGTTLSGLRQEWDLRTFSDQADAFIWQQAYNIAKNRLPAEIEAEIGSWGSEESEGSSSSVAPTLSQIELNRSGAYYYVNLPAMLGRAQALSDTLKARLAHCNIPEKQIKKMAMDLMKSAYGETLSTKRLLSFDMPLAGIDGAVVTLVKERFNGFLLEIGGGEEYDCLTDARNSFAKQLETEDPVATLQQWTAERTKRTWLEAIQLGQAAKKVA